MATKVIKHSPTFYKNQSLTRSETRALMAMLATDPEQRVGEAVCWLWRSFSFTLRKSLKLNSYLYIYMYSDLHLTFLFIYNIWVSIHI